MDNRTATALVQEALVHGLDGRNDEALAIIQRLGVEGGIDTIFGAAAAFAETTRQMLLKLDPSAAGGTWVPESLVGDIEKGDPSSRFAVRYVAAHANGDREMAMDLLFAELRHPDPARFAKAIVELLSMAVSMLRAWSDEKKLRDEEAGRG